MVIEDRYSKQNHAPMIKISISRIIEGLDLDLDAGYIDITEEPHYGIIFSWQYQTIDENGFDTGRRRKILNIRKSNLMKLENSLDKNAQMIDEVLLEKQGLNILPEIHRYDFQQYEPKPIFRNIPVDYGSLISTPMYGIRPEGTDTTYLEMNWKGEDESGILFESLGAFDPRLVSEGHEIETRNYNKRLKRALKGSILVEITRLMDEICGSHKNVFDFRGHHHLRRELGHIKGVNRSNYLTTSIDWLSEIEDSIGGWYYSVTQIQKTEWKNYRDFFKNSLENMIQNLRLEDTRYWDERREPGVHIDYLKKALVYYRILAEQNGEASEKLFARVRDMGKDLGFLMEKIIDR